jgi:hypothetical protein
MILSTKHGRAPVYVGKAHAVGHERAGAGELAQVADGCEPPLERKPGHGGGIDEPQCAADEDCAHAQLGHLRERPAKLCTIRDWNLDQLDIECLGGSLAARESA